MKQIVKYIFFVGVTLMSLSCSKNRVIPDDELCTIFKELYITNAYNSIQYIYKDSLDLYTPVLEKYGYTNQDLIFTIGNFSKRKSARLSDIVDEVIVELGREFDHYDKIVNGMARVDSIAQERMRETVYEDDRVVVRGFGDTAKLRVVVPVKAGRYDIAYNYLQDTLGAKSKYLNDVVITDTNDMRLNGARIILKRGERELYTKSFEFEEGTVGEMTVKLADYSRSEVAPKFEVDSLRITYFPPAEKAVAKLDSARIYIPTYSMRDSIELRFCSLPTGGGEELVDEAEGRADGSAEAVLEE